MQTPTAQSPTAEPPAFVYETLFDAFGFAAATIGAHLNAHCFSVPQNIAPFGLKRRLLRDSNTSGIEGKAEM
jgi:hypothetical protein